MKSFLLSICCISIAFPSLSQEDKVFPVAQEMPTLQECAHLTDWSERRACTDEKIEAALTRYLEYPQEANKAGVDGFVIVRFVVDKKGKTMDFSVAEDPGFGLADAAIKAVKKIGKWVPGSIRGEDVNVRMSVPVRFQMPQEQEVVPVTVVPDVYDVVEEMPRFAGCHSVDAAEAQNCTVQNVVKYMRTHLVYPESARKQDVLGTVIVEFVIDETGSVKHAKVKEGIGAGCDEEAIRLVNSMPPWSPGKQGGKPVKVRMELPLQCMPTARE
jgi:TonB family protein